jgi:hypothetical protein
MQTDLFIKPFSRQPLVVCYGAGRDSTAVLVGLHQRGIRPDLIIHADTGSEREATYAYIPIINAWCRKVGFPEVTIVVNKVSDFKRWPPYHSLEENILTNRALASISYGHNKCSPKWKIAPQNKFLKTWQPAIDRWAAGAKVRKAIGFEDSPHERRRSKGCSTYAVQEEETDKFDIWFPLQEWKWNLERCIEEIKAAGLPVPSKSSCYFCAAMKPWEVEELSEEKLKRIVVIEARTKLQHLEYAERKGWPKGVGVPLTDGIWRKPVKGFRITKNGPKPNGAVARPGSMTEYIRQKGLLPSEEIDRLIAATPTHHLYRSDFTDWQAWLDAICYPERNAERLAA